MRNLQKCEPNLQRIYDSCQPTVEGEEVNLKYETSFWKKNRGRIRIKYNKMLPCVHFEWWVVAICYMILGILLDVCLLSLKNIYTHCF